MLADVLAGVKELLRIGDRREQDEYREEIPSKGKCTYSLKKTHLQHMMSRTLSYRNG